MALTEILFLSIFFAFCFISIIYHPISGLLIYYVVYLTSPATKWWGMAFNRYALFSVVAISLGVLFHSRKIKIESKLSSQELLFIIFVLIIWTSTFIGLNLSSDVSNSMKMAKIFIVMLMARFIVNDINFFDLIVWVFIAMGVYVAYEAYNAPSWAFTHGRIDRGIGGVDFRDSNFLSSHLVSLLPLVAIMFFKKGFWYKLVCIVSAGFIVNGIILCRSRGALLAMAVASVAALFLSVPRKRKIQLLLILSIGVVVGFNLMDQAFIERMTTISTETEEMDASSQGRVLAWRAAYQMFQDHPFGIGEGNFTSLVGAYNPDIDGLDTHNTFMRCLAELGLHGFFVYLLLYVNAFLILQRTWHKAYLLTDKEEQTRISWYVFAIKLSLIAILTTGMTMSHTYVEGPYWFLFFPVLLENSTDNKIIGQKKNNPKKIMSF